MTAIRNCSNTLYKFTSRYQSKVEYMAIFKLLEIADIANIKYTYSMYIYYYFCVSNVTLP